MQTPNDGHWQPKYHKIAGDVGSCVRVPKGCQVNTSPSNIAVPYTLDGCALKDGGSDAGNGIEKDICHHDIDDMSESSIGLEDV